MRLMIGLLILSFSNLSFSQTVKFNENYKEIRIQNSKNEILDPKTSKILSNTESITLKDGSTVFIKDSNLLISEPNLLRNADSITLRDGLLINVAIDIGSGTGGGG